MKDGYSLKYTKFIFATVSVKYLGHIIQNNTIRPVKGNLVSIRNFPTPKSQRSYQTQYIE